MNLIQDMNLILTDDILEYAMSLYVDTRLELSLTNQLLNAPAGLTSAMAFMLKFSKDIPRAISEYEIKSQAIAVQIEQTKDPLRRIALWGVYVKTHGRDT